MVMEMNTTTLVSLCDKFEPSFNCAVLDSLQLLVVDGFLETFFKATTNTDRERILVDRFGEAARLELYQNQAEAIGAPVAVLSLLFSTAVFSSSTSWPSEDNGWYHMTPYGSEDGGDSEMSAELIPDIGLSVPPEHQLHIPLQTQQLVEEIPVDDQPITAENSRRKRKRKSKTNASKQQSADQTQKDQSTTEPKAKHISAKRKKNTAPEVANIITGYHPVDQEEAMRVRDILIYDIPSTWEPRKILAELKLWGNTILLATRRQHKYQTVKVTIALSSFTLPQLGKYWTTDLGGIPVRWFPAKWTLKERKEREKFQAVIMDIPEEMTTASLWVDQKPHEFLTSAEVKSFKIINLGKGKRKLVGYFENWEILRTALETKQVFHPVRKELQ
jgi:hypothetical protein